MELGGKMPKNDRIRRMIPLFEEHRVWLPIRCIFADYERKAQDLTYILVEELKAFPVSEYDDTMDCASRILDIGAVFPEPSVKIPGAHVIDTVETDYDLFPNRRS